MFVSHTHAVNFLRNNYTLLLDKVGGKLELLPDFDTLQDKLYGCGTRGCVWQLADKKKVFKITVDDGSMPVIQKLITKPLPGLPKFHKVVSINRRFTTLLDPGSDDTKSLGIWRENVTDVGTLPRRLIDACNVYQTMISWFANAFHAFVLGVDNDGMEVTQEDIMESLQALAASINAFRLEGAGKIYDGIIAGLIEHQCLLADLHKNNIGRNYNGDWVIFDPIFYPLDPIACGELLQHA